MARHRSPEGRRAHLGPPLSAVLATAGVGGGARLPFPSTSRLASALPSTTTSLPARFVATVVAGGALAAAGQHVLAETLPAAADGANVLRIGVEELIGSSAESAAALTTTADADPVVVAPLVALAPVAPAAAAEQPVVADAANLVKAADLQTAAAEVAAAETARVAEVARVAEATRVAEAARVVESTAAAAVSKVSAAGGIQMIQGRVTSGFGARWGSSHRGLDIAAPIGTPIKAPLGGTVIDSGPASGFGLWVRVKHSDGTVTVYGHINRSLVNKGEKVSAGQTIAEVGNRGQSTGPHLHIEVITPGGTKVNPRPWLDERGIGYN